MSAICTHHQEHKLQSTAVGTRDCYGVLEAGWSIGAGCGWVSQPQPAIDRGGGQRHAPTAVLPRSSHGAPHTGGFGGGGQSWSEQVREISSSSGFELRTTSQSVTSRCSDCGVLAHDIIFKVIDVKNFRNPCKLIYLGYQP
jgi:hypothetical protein